MALSRRGSGTVTTVSRWSSSHQETRFQIYRTELLMRLGSTTLPSIFSAAVLMVAFGAVPLAAQASGSNRLCQELNTVDSLLVQRRVVEPTARRMPDLNCIDLFSTARGGNAHGLIRLKRVSSPFGVTVTADGHHIYELIAWLDGLPDPSNLGPYTDTWHGQRHWS